MKNTYKLIWTDEALNGLVGIIRYLEKNFSVKVVKKFVEKFEKQLEIISSNPEIFSNSPKLKNVRRSIVANLTSIYYLIDGDVIYLLSIRDNRMNPDKIKLD